MLGDRNKHWLMIGGRVNAGQSVGSRGETVVHSDLQNTVFRWFRDSLNFKSEHLRPRDKAGLLTLKKANF